ncbi:MAG: hypothetical protein KIT74_01500 [Fimbriimonadales bacterium]|nr:hypothetical protein [Fimbriimonadales bacterium]
MRLELGEQSISLDASGAAIILGPGVLCINEPTWSTDQGALFPDAGLERKLHDDIERLVGVHRIDTVALLGRQAPRESEKFEDFLRSFGPDVVWIGADEQTLHDGASSMDVLDVEGLLVALNPMMRPAIVGGFAPGDTGGACFLLDNDQLLLPSVGSLYPRLPEELGNSCRAFWIGGRGISESAFEGPKASLR